MTQEQEREKWIAERVLQAMENDGIDYSDDLQAMANRIFPWASQERQRQEWMAAAPSLAFNWQNQCSTRGMRERPS
jgi:hypothetical protein